MKKIGLLGLTFADPNKGCMALAYSFYNILCKLFPTEKLNITIFSDHEYSIEHLDSKHKINLVTYKMKNISSMINLKKEIKKCDIFFDFTEGDSFSDIYGVKRFIKYSIVKNMVINQNKELILCPQTFGPFNKKVSKLIAKRIITKAEYVCTRDETSTKYIKELTGLNVDTFTDVAFMLPTKKNCDIEKNEKINVGINISALLCNGGYDSNNQFSLKTDFLEYVKSIINYMLDSKLYNIYLIPHVYGENMPKVENDFLWCKQIYDMFPECHIVEQYFSPTEIKGVISQMDLFIGARMHSTIGAFSSLVPVIPFSYSRKFEGLYNSLNYKYVIKAREWDLEKSLLETKKYMKELNKMKNEEIKSMDNVKQINELFENKIGDLIKGKKND